MITRQEIVDFARQFKGVQYKHQGRTGQGLDCGGILVLLAEELGIYHESKEQLRYGGNPEKFILKQELDRYFVKIRLSEIQRGDIVLMKIVASRPHHIAIVSEYSAQSFGIIHTYDTVGKVVEHRMNQMWRDKIVQSYKVPGVV